MKLIKLKSQSSFEILVSLRPSFNGEGTLAREKTMETVD